MVEHTYAHTHTHILLITQVTGSPQEHSKLPFSPVSVLTLSLLAMPWKYTNFVFLSCLVWLMNLHQSLFWECHSARVKRRERLIWRSSLYRAVLHCAVRPVSVSSFNNCDLCPSLQQHLCVCVCLAESLLYINEWHIYCVLWETWPVQDTLTFWSLPVHLQLSHTHTLNKHTNMCLCMCRWVRQSVISNTLRRARRQRWKFISTQM